MHGYHPTYYIARTLSVTSSDWVGVGLKSSSTYGYLRECCGHEVGTHARTRLMDMRQCVHGGMGGHGMAVIRELGVVGGGYDGGGRSRGA